MVDLITYRSSIGVFSAVAALPSTVKRIKSLFRKLKRSRRPIENFRLKSFIFLGTIVLLVGVCASTYKDSGRVPRSRGTLDHSDAWLQNGTTACKNTDSLDVSNSQNSSFQIYSFDLEYSSSNIKISAIFCYSQLRTERHRYHTLPTKDKLLFGDFVLIPTLMCAGGTNAYLLGNVGVHAYNGNPGSKEERSPESGPSSTVDPDHKKRRIDHEADRTMEQQVYFERKSLTAVQGSIELEQVDVIVCDVDRRLNLATSGTVAKRLLAVGGKTLMEECKSTFPSGIKDGEIVAISGGNLKCKNIYLTSLPDYVVEDKKEEEEGQIIQRTHRNKVLKNAISNIINKAIEHNMRSVAFPAIGINKLNLSTVTKSLLETVTATKHPIDIKFVMHDKNTIEEFVQIEKDRLQLWGVPEWLKQRTANMISMVEHWKKMDKYCYETASVKAILEKISGDENYLSVTGVHGSGKSTAIHHAALYLQNQLGYIIYPIAEPKEFISFLETDKKQVFVMDNPVGDRSIDDAKLKSWNTYNGQIMDCLNHNSKIKFLSSIRLQLSHMQALKGTEYVFNHKKHMINISEKELSSNEMRIMLSHHLNVAGRQMNIDIDLDIFKYLQSDKAKKFAKCFPLLCKILVLGGNIHFQQDIRNFFLDPFQGMIDIFERLRVRNIHLFCGLVLCAHFSGEMKDDVLRPIDPMEGFIGKKTKEKRDYIIESEGLHHVKDLQRIKQTLVEHDGIYTIHLRATFKFCHTIFQDIVAHLNGEPFSVIKYETSEIIFNRVRIDEAFGDDVDDKYIIILKGFDQLADNLLKDYQQDAYTGVKHILMNRYVDDDRLHSSFRKLLFDGSDVTIDTRMAIINDLFRGCMNNIGYDLSIDYEICPEYKLAVKLVEWGANCDVLIDVIMRPGLQFMVYPIHLSIWAGCVPLTKTMLRKGVNMHKCNNQTYVHSVLHFLHNAKHNQQDLARLIFNQDQYRHVLIASERQFLPDTYTVHHVVKDERNLNYSPNGRHFKRPGVDISWAQNHWEGT